MRKKEKTGAFYQQVYSISLQDMLDIWIEHFHSFGTVLVICDAGSHFRLLQDCGILCSQLNAYNNKLLTVELAGVDEAIKVMDNIHAAGYHPVMYLYDNGRQILDNVEP